MSKIISTLLVGLLIGVAGGESLAQETSPEEMRSLDEQVQEIKSDVLGIAADFSQLEERLLYPSNTHVAVFVSLTEGDSFRLDAVQIQIDEQLATHYIYSFTELEALQNGGVQRIYTGNVTTGNHVLGVTYTGKLQSGREFTHTENFTFNKDVDPKLLGLTLAGPDSASPVILLRDW